MAVKIECAIAAIAATSAKDILQQQTPIPVLLQLPQLLQ